MESIPIITAALLIIILNAINQLHSEIKCTNSILEKMAKQIGVSDKVTENIDDELKN